MGVFNVFKIMQMVPNRATRHIYQYKLLLKGSLYGPLTEYIFCL